MNKHDQSRKDALIKALCKAKEQADLALIYLNANNRDMRDICAVNDALEHIEIALEQLGAAVPATF
jgi:hypothetical protein